MTQAELIEACIEAFGGEQRLADAIPPAGRRVVLRWANGSVRVPQSVWGEIGAQLRLRIMGLQGLARDVRRFADGEWE